MRHLEYCHIVHTHKPLDANTKCSIHKTGCGRALRLGSLVKIDAYEMQNVDGSVIYTSARLINSEGRRTCKVGVVKTFFDQVELVGNRVGVVTEIAYYTKEGTKVMEDNQNGRRVMGVQKNSKGEGAKSKGTIDLARNCHGYATVTFIDGGGVTLKDPVNYDEKTMVAVAVQNDQTQSSPEDPEVVDMTQEDDDGNDSEDSTVEASNQSKASKLLHEDLDNKRRKFFDGKAKTRKKRKTASATNSMGKKKQGYDFKGRK